MKPRRMALSPRGMNLLKRRGWQVALSTVMLAGLAFTAVAGWIGTPIGSRNFALGLSLGCERRAFCRYVCPMGGFIGLYSQVAPVEMRVDSRATCAACQTKACYNGSPEGYGCPWGGLPAR